LTLSKGQFLDQEAISIIWVKIAIVQFALESETQHLLFERKYQAQQSILGYCRGAVTGSNVK